MRTSGKSSWHKQSYYVIIRLATEYLFIFGKLIKLCTKYDSLNDLPQMVHNHFKLREAPGFRKEGDKVWKQKN